jgi:hypothetical protein
VNLPLLICNSPSCLTHTAYSARLIYISRYIGTFRSRSPYHAFLRFVPSHTLFILLTYLSDILQYLFLEVYNISRSPYRARMSIYPYTFLPVAKVRGKLSLSAIGIYIIVCLMR